MSVWKVTTSTILMVVFTGLVKAYGHFIRLALLAILGLLGMYLLHKLAQDYNKIKGNGSGGSGGGGAAKPPRVASLVGMAAKLLRLTKRSVDTQEVTEAPLENLISKFTSILYLDPIGCARKFVCYSASKPAANLTENEFNLLKLFQLGRRTNKAFDQFQEAAKLGEIYKNMTVCEKKYKACYLSSKQLYTFYSFF